MLSADNITLRALEPSDIDWLYKCENDTGIWQVSNTIVPYSRHVLEQYILNSQLDIYTTKQLRLIIELTADKKIIGCIDLFDFDPHHRRAGVGVLITDKASLGKGNASAALSLLINYVFTKLNLHQLYCNVSAKNEASIKLFIKHGFEITGIKKQWVIRENNWDDEYMLQLINKRV
ncbi:MAG: GNAT family N-acetyltransferase [Bacteroidia bacterium]|nr:GNAT family N-acetyltransferase [Bacteroidia bacterium]